LTGAGKGGCISLLVREEYSHAMCAYLDAEYYGKPEHFEAYHQLLLDELRFSEPAARSMNPRRSECKFSDSALAASREQRRVITFSRGACALELCGT